MKQKVTLIVFFSFFSLCQLFAATISGTVTDEHNQAVPFATIYIKGTTKGTTSNIQGNYSIELKDGTYELVFKLIGYKPHIENLTVIGSNIKVDATTTSFDRVLKQFYDKGVTQEELDKAKATIKNSRLSIENPASIIEFYNPILYKDVNKRNELLAVLDAITIEQVNKAVKKYYNPDSYKLVMVGDETVLEPQLQKIVGLVKLPVTSIEKDN